MKEVKPMRVGILGSGQLARMMAQATQKLTVSFAFVAEPGDATEAVNGLGDVITANPTQSSAALFEAMGRPNVITVEKEHVDATRLEALSAFCAIAPNPKAVAMTQHRNREKHLLREVGIPTVGFANARDWTTLSQAIADIGYPVIVKSCEEGYDGKNQWRLQSPADMHALRTQLNTDTLDVVVEQWVNFSAEVSMLAVRAASGAVRFYPLTQNQHRNGILFTSLAPAPVATPTLQATAENYLSKLLTALDYVGVLAMECFVVGDQLLVNELAPRVHNSGHWTQQGCQTSQFENHIRAILDLPLGDTQQTQPAGMLNLLGITPDPTRLTEPNCTLHWYDKLCKPGRKVGHINVTAQTTEDVKAALQRLSKVVYGGNHSPDLRD